MGKHDLFEFLKRNNVEIKVYPGRDYSSMTQMIKYSQELEELTEALQSRLTEAEKVIGLMDTYYPVIEPEGCCNGRDCACLGLPTNPEHYAQSMARSYLSKYATKEGSEK